jgi:hypothetical protein
VNEYHEDTWLGRNEDLVALLAIASFLVAILVIIVFVSRRDRQRYELCVPVQNGTTMTPRWHIDPPMLIRLSPLLRGLSHEA